MTATYTWDIFSTLDGYGSYSEHGDWGGYWGKQGPEFLDHRLAQYSQDLRLVLGANTYRAFAHMLATEPSDSDVHDSWVTRMRHLPTTVVSNTLTTFASPYSTRPPRMVSRTSGASASITER